MATLSVYLGQGAATLRGATARGAVNAYGRDVDGGHVVVVGELPAETVRRIAEAVTTEALPPP
jgi:negative regulator of sigma E activity